MQYSGRYSLRMCDAINTEEAHHQCGGECAVRWRRYAVWICHTIITDEVPQKPENTKYGTFPTIMTWTSTEMWISSIT